MILCYGFILSYNILLVTTLYQFYISPKPKQYSLGELDHAGLNSSSGTVSLGAVTEATT